MNDSTSSNQFIKSPLILLVLVAVLVVATLVAASEYFLRPQIESELKQEITRSFVQAGFSIADINLSGRDVTLNGAVSSKLAAQKVENTTKQIWGVRQIDNQIIIKKP
ncbi:MAG: BON domain-containing protein [Cocleimonas sp.]|nr:BON domain-containing protein [Cocleimonas sp.]